jgi:hypothetical protein
MREMFESKDAGIIMIPCKLIIKDEVNCRLEGLPIEIRRKLANKFKFMDPTARHRPSVKLGRWSGEIAFFSIGGDGYIAHLPEILKILEENDVEIVEFIDNRLPFNLNFSTITHDFWGDTRWQAGHPKAGELIKLREDQVCAANEALSNPQSIQCLSTSFGKTILTATLSKACEKYGRTIIIVPNKSLVEQTELDYKNCSLDVGVYYGTRKELDKTHTICTWQSLGVLDKKSKNYSSADEFTFNNFISGVNAIIVDECFDGETPILTINGYVNIKDIKSGDVIINYNENTKTFKTDNVIKQHINLNNSTNEKMYELEFDDGTKLKVTGNHKFLTSDGWVRADELSEHDEIISYKPNT